MPQLVFGCAVPFLFLYDFEAAALAGIGRIEDVGKKFDSFAQAFDDAEPLLIVGTLEHLHHVSHIRGVRARDKGCSAGDQFFHWVHWLIDCAGWIRLGFESDRRGWRRLSLR